VVVGRLRTSTVKNCARWAARPGARGSARRWARRARSARSGIEQAAHFGRAAGVQARRGRYAGSR
jgi:hypothetical protein